MSIDLEAIKIVTFEALLGTKLSFYEMAKNFDWKDAYEKLPKALVESKSAKEALKKLSAEKRRSWSR